MDSAASQQATGLDRNGTAGDGQAGAPVLHRWIALRGSAAQPNVTAPAEFRLERAAATALGRAAERQAQLPVFVEKVELARMTLPELPEFLPERALLIVVEGRRDALGVVAVCPAMLASLIEMQAIGRVTSRPAPARRPTRTDALISADFVNALLAELARESVGQDLCPNFGAFHYATYLDDPRPLALMLEDGDMVRLTLRFRIGASGQRDGTLMIALPIDQASRALLPTADIPGASPPQADRHAAPASKAPAPAASLSEMVQQAPVNLVGVLCRRKVSLQMLRNLTPGALIPLPPNTLDDARIETPQGQLLACGRLGEAEGFHAIRLRDLARTDAADPPAGPVMSESFTPATQAMRPAPVPAPAAGTPAEPPLQDFHQSDPFRSPADPAARFAG